MDFRQRAHTALERNEPGRAMMVLVNGLRREPDRDEALDLLLFIYVHHFNQPGMESELLRGLEFQPQRSNLLRLVIDKLEEEEKWEMAVGVEEAAREHGVDVAEPVITESPRESSDAGGGEQGDSIDDVESTPAMFGEVDVTAAMGEGGEDSKGKKDNREKGEDLPAHPVFPTGRQNDETSGDVAQTGEESPSSTTSPSTKEKGRWKAMSGKRQILVVAGALLFAVVGASITVMGWQHAQDLQSIRAVDRAMIAFDPQEPERVLEVIDEARTPTRGRDDELNERERFVAAVIALDSGQKPDGGDWTAEPETSWGLAASAFKLAKEEEWEEAMQFVNFLERAYGDTLAAYYARGRVCEARRDWNCATGRYHRVLQHFEEFVPAHQGLMRVAARRFDIEEWQQAQDELAEIDSEHPYLKLPWIDPFETTNPDLPKGESWRGDEDSDRFVAVLFAAAAVLDNLSAEQWEEAARQCSEVRISEFGAFPALEVACAQAMAGTVDAEAAVSYFEIAARDATRSEYFLRHLQQLAPQVLVDLGRAEWALRFTIGVDDAFEGGTPQESPDYLKSLKSMRPAHFEAVIDEPDLLDARALLTRARVLSALGATEEARHTLGPLKQKDEIYDRVHFEWVWSYLVEGDRRSAEAGLEDIDDPSLRQGARAYIAYLEGDYGEAYRLVDEKELDIDARLVRVKTLALHADGRGRHAVATIESFDGGLDTLGLIPVRERVFARSDAGAKGEDPEEDEAISGLNFLIDRGAAKLWRRDLSSAERHFTRVLERVPDHPEANWKMGLLKRVEGREGEARQHFRRAWRGAEDSTELLIEAGRVQLEAGEYERARRIFLRAVLRERRNTEAIGGLGKAYEAGDRARGRRDLPELLGNYSSTPGDAPARAEMNRWIAIVHGSRQGDEEAFEYLERAREIGGDRVPVLAEMGRYFEARKEWGKARRHYGTALRINPTMAEIHLAIARVSEATGDVEAARDHLEHTMRLGPVAQVREEAEALKDRLDEVSDGD